jgi:glycosyltransferase involved in cell wall biosynthesis
MPCTIAYVDHALETGGAQKSLIELIARLDRSRFDPVLVHSEGADWVSDPALGDIRRVAAFEPSAMLEARRDEGPARWMPHLLRFGASAKPFAAAHKALRDIDPAVIHTNSVKSHFLGGVAARRLRKPLIWHIRDILEGRALQFLRRSAQMLRPNVIAISEAVAGQFDGLDIPVTVIHNGVPLDRFAAGKPSEGLRRDLGIERHAPVVIIVGRLTPWKGHRDLLAAFAQVRETRPEAVLLVVGAVAFWDEAYETELRLLAEREGIGESVYWLGNRDDVPELLRLADIFCLPSVNEPFGRAIVEAMAVAKPVVACRAGGVPEVVAEGETGLLVKPEAPEELTEALEALLADPKYAKAMGDAGRERAARLFDANRVADEVQTLYAKLCG